jgi:toxin ParE1/3/4
MAELRFTNKAVEDLSNIWNYTFDVWSEKQADLYYNMLIEQCNAIAENPSLGKSYETVEKRLCGIIAGKHIIFYRDISDGLIEVVRILHGSMDLRNRIKD